MKRWLLWLSVPLVLFAIAFGAAVYAGTAKHALMPWLSLGFWIWVGITPLAFVVTVVVWLAGLRRPHATDGA
jgi:hypothetical protein